VIPFLGGCRLAETDRTVARNYITALQEGGRSANTIRQAKVVLGAMFGMAVADGYLDYNPFHDVKIPKVPGRRAIKIATPEQYLKVRACLPTKPARVFSTLLVSSGMRFCEAIGLQPADFDLEAGILEVARSVVKVSREHHPQGKTFLVRDYTKNGQTRRLKARRGRGRARAGIRGGARHWRDGGDVPGGAGGSAAAHQGVADGGGDQGAG
jgi:integrase